MRKEQEEPSSRGFHNLQPHRDLESNWGVDVAKNLEDYLLKICSGEIAAADHDNANCLSVNFAEAALLLQGSVQVYSRKVEYLYSLVLHALEFITQKSEQDHPESASAQAEENANDEENDPFWVSEEIPVEAKNLLDSATHRDSSLTQLVKPPANLVVREGDCLDSTGDSGELESYLLATCDLYRDFILLDSCDAVAVDNFWNNDVAGKGLNNSCRGGSVGSKHRKSFLSPTRVSEGTANKFSAQKSHDANFCMPPRVEPEFGPASYKGDCDMPDNYDNGNCDIPDNYDDGHGGEDGYPEPRDSDDSDDEDPWKPLNPHEPGDLKVKPYRKVNFSRRQGVDSRKRASLAIEFTLARLHGTTSSDLNDIWEKKYCAMKKQGDSQSPPPYEKLRESLIRGLNEDYDDLFSPKENNEENEYDSGDPDFGQPDYDVPELADANEDVTQHGEKHKNYGSPFDNGTHEYPDAHANLEDLCRSHLDALLDNLAETEKQSELAARVSTWRQRIEQNLEEQDSHPPFDIAEYGARVLGKLSLEGNSTNSMSFSDVVMGQKKHDVARTFSALLQLVNNGDVDLEKGRTNEFTCYTAVNPFYVRLLRRDNRPKMQLQSPKERANSSISNRYRKRKNKGKENQAPLGSSPSAPSSACSFAVKFGKFSGTRCTPESKKRRKSRIVEPVELHTAL